jgi:hypothetical protein
MMKPGFVGQAFLPHSCLPTGLTADAEKRSTYPEFRRWETRLPRRLDWLIASRRAGLPAPQFFARCKDSQVWFNFGTQAYPG